MWLKKVILVIIFVWCSADSKQPGGFKIQLKDGNFYFGEGNGDVPIDLMNKGADISSLDRSGIQTKSSSSNILHTLDLLDKTIYDLSNGAENKKQFSDLDNWNKREKIGALRQLLGESKLVDAASVDETDAKGPTKDVAQVISEKGSDNKKETEVVKVTNSDLQKIRNVLDKEYGKSILLIPKNDLESFIHFVNEYSVNDMLRNSDTKESKIADERSRLPDVSRNPNSLNMLSQPCAKTDWQAPEENRQEILQEFVRFLDKGNTVEESPSLRSSAQNELTSLIDSNNQNSYSKSGYDSSYNNLARQENNISLEAVKNFLDNLTEDKSQMKQSLTGWFEKYFENENPRQVHTNIRRSIKNTTSSPIKREKNCRKLKEKATKPTSTYQRISRCDLPILRKRLRNLSDQAGLSWSSGPPHSDPKRFADQQSLTSELNKMGENSFLGNEKWQNEDLSSEPRLTRAAFIR